MNLTEIVQATLVVYKECAIDATRALRKSWPLIPGSFLAYLLFLFLYNILSIFSINAGAQFAIGFILGFIHIGLLSLYYRWLSEARDRQGLSIKDLLLFDRSLFFQTISVAFIFFLIDYFLSSLFRGIQQAALFPLFLQLALVFAFNAIPEVIYLRRLDGMSALGTAVIFLRDNSIEWLLPFVVVLLPAVLLSPGGAVVLLSQSEPLLPPLTVVTAWKPFVIQYSWQHGSELLGWGLTILSLVIANWYMLFRGYLYNALESGTRRTRAFRAKMGS